MEEARDYILISSGSEEDEEKPKLVRQKTKRRKPVVPKAAKSTRRKPVVPKAEKGTRRKPLLPVARLGVSLEADGMLVEPLTIPKGLIDEMVLQEILFLEEFARSRLSAEDQVKYPGGARADDTYDSALKRFVEFRNIGDPETRYAVQGPNAQFFTWLAAGTKNGFGVTSHITGTTKQLEMLQVISAARLDPKPQGLPGCILKVPEIKGVGKELNTHLDAANMSLKQLHEELMRTLTLDEWVANHNVQRLAHLRCGSGATWGFEGQDMRTMRVISYMLNPATQYPKITAMTLAKRPKIDPITEARWAKPVKGPNFVPIEKFLVHINDVLGALHSFKGQEIDEYVRDMPDLIRQEFLNSPLHQLKHVRMMDETTGPAVVTWPAGFWHGSAGDIVDVRSTMALAGDNVLLDTVKLVRSKNRIRACYFPEERSNPEHKIEDAEGVTHLHPELRFVYFDTLPTYRAMYPPTWAEYEVMFKSMYGDV